MNELTQEEAQYLISIAKEYMGDKIFEYPDVGGKLNIDLQSHDGKEDFILDITRSRIDFMKYTFQNRVRKAITLIRIDIGGAPHRNPDGKEIGIPHIHIYKERYGDKYAYKLPSNFDGCKDTFDYLNAFMDFCNIVKKPKINMRLF